MSAPRVAATILAHLIAASVQASSPGGSFTVEGHNPDGGAYRGQLRVQPRGEAWHFAWTTGAESEGVGVESEGRVAVALGGAACAVVLYRWAEDGLLQGRWALPGGGRLGRETATPGRGHASGLAGDYLVEGSNPDGASYRGALSVTQEGEHWRLSWRTGTNFEGFGIERDGWLAVSFGSPDCGVALYRAVAGGDLDGIWKYYRSGLGTERAARE